MHTTNSNGRGRAPHGLKPISKDAQAVLELLIEGLGGTADDERASRKIDNAPGTYMAVTVERVGAAHYSVAHYHEQNGDLMRDPEVVFWKGPDGRFYPVEFTQDGLPTPYQRLVEFTDGEPGAVMARQQRSCATFCATWMANIKEQQGLKRPRGRPPGGGELVRAAKELGVLEHVHVGDPSPPSSPEPGMEVRDIPVDRVMPNPNQPRKVFDQQALEDLAGSIESSKLQQPIKVRPTEAGGFMIVCGERRWRAHVLLGRPTIPAIVQDMTDDQMEDAAIIENLQRSDISQLEEARAFQRRLDAGLSVEELARRLGIRQPHRITERTCLLRLHPEYQELFDRGDLKPSQAYELAQLEGDYQRALFNAIRDGKCKSYGALRAVAKAFRDAAANAVPVLVVQNKDTQVTMFDDSGPTEAERLALSALERKILAVEKLVADGFKDNEVVILAKVARANASVMADRLGLISRQLDKMRLALLAQSAVVKAPAEVAQ
jgi:ParB family transcriptional regulator, chromosome partitioning protein